MRIEDRLADLLMGNAYKKLDTNGDSVILFYRPGETEGDIVALISVYSGRELTKYQYEQLIEKIKYMFGNMNHMNNNLLSVILTANPSDVKDFSLDSDNHWIIDITNSRLIIYENQLSDYKGLKNEIDQILDEIHNSQGKSGGADDINNRINITNNNRLNRYGHRSGIGWISLFNTAIIAINILIFILIQYTPILGETDKAMTAGALSWYKVKEGGEYYRIITSMFLHQNISHLFNNMLVLFFVGDNFERAAGKLRYVLIYFGAGIIAGISSIVYNMRNDDYIFTLSVGASGAIFGIVGAMLYILIINKGRVEDISIVQIALFAAFSLYGGFSSANIDNAGHIGGFIGGLILAVLLYRKPKKQQLNTSSN